MYRTELEMAALRWSRRIGCGRGYLDQSDQPGIPGIRVAMAAFDVSATQPLPLLQGSYEWVGDPVDASWKSARIVTVNCAAAGTSPV